MLFENVCFFDQVEEVHLVKGALWELELGLLLDLEAELALVLDNFSEGLDKPSINKAYSKYLLFLHVV